MAQKLSRRDLARYAAQQLSEGASQRTIALQLAAYLIETRRVKELSVIVRDIATHLVDYGHVAGNVISAHELSEATLREIEAYTKQQTGASEVSLSTVVDKSVLGGVRLELPGRELDTTIARHLTILKTRYKKA